MYLNLVPNEPEEEEVDPGKPCPNCQGMIRETRGLICDICGRDYLQERPVATKRF